MSGTASGEDEGATIAADRAAVERLWPSIEVGMFEPTGDGWTCRTYAVNGEWIAQLPRTGHAEASLRKQLGVLPQLAGRLPAPIPAPVPAAAAEPLAMLYRRISGAPFPEAPLGAWPEQLGGLLRSLRAIAPESVGIERRSAGTLRGERRALLETMVRRVVPLLAEAEQRAFDQRFAEHLEDDANWRFTPVLTHGDLGPEHILVDGTGSLAGVIDWEELAAGDPASDVAWLLHAHPAIGERVLVNLEEAGDEALRCRAAFLYALMPFHEVVYGLESDQPEFVASGVRGIRERM